MPTSGDVVLLDLGIPHGSEAGFSRPAVIVTAASVLKRSPSVLQVVPLTSTIRAWASDVLIEADADNGLAVDSVAQCQHIRAVASSRTSDPVGRITNVQLRQVRDTLALLLDID